MTCYHILKNGKKCCHCVQRRTVTTCSVLPGTQVLGPKIICRTQFVHLHISEPTPGPSGTQSQTTPGPSHTQSCQPMPQKRSSGAARAGNVENYAVCMSNSPSKIWTNIHLVFYPAMRSAKKRKCQATTDPDSERCPLLTATPQAPWAFQAQRERTRKISSSWTTNRKR